VQCKNSFQRPPTSGYYVVKKWIFPATFR